MLCKTVIDDVEIKLYDRDGNYYKTCYGSIGVDGLGYVAEFFADNFWFRLGAKSEKTIRRCFENGLKKHSNYDYIITKFI